MRKAKIQSRPDERSKAVISLPGDISPGYLRACDKISTGSFMLEKMKNSRYFEGLRKIGFTLVVLAAYRILSLIVLPGVDINLISSLSSRSSLFETINAFTGGALDRCSIMALGIMPYITATILTQILSSSLGFEDFRKLKKDKEVGSMKMNEWTKSFTVFIATANALYLVSNILKMNHFGKYAVYISPALFYFIATPMLVAGSLLSVWASNQISRYGVGQGTSFLVFSGIVSGSLQTFSKIADSYRAGLLHKKYLFMIAALFASLLVFCIFMEMCVRNIPVRYLGIRGSSDMRQLPLKINNAGVLAVVMASSLMHFPQMIIGFFRSLGLFTETLEKYASYVSSGGPFYYFFYGTLIVMFTLAQTEISFDPEEVASHLEESGIVVLKTRPGAETAKKLRQILTFLNVIASIYLLILCLLSEYCCAWINRMTRQSVLHLTGTSFLIATSIASQLYSLFAFHSYQKIIEDHIHGAKEMPALSSRETPPHVS